jgi:cytochrome c553
VKITRTMSTLALTIGLGACGGTTPPPSSPPATTAASTEAVPETSPPESASAPPPAASEASAAKPKPSGSGTPLDQLMREHFKQVGEIRHAVISGKPKDAVQPALALGNTVDIPNQPKAWLPSMERMRTASSRVQNSADLAEAAAGTADIGLACGSCHESQGGPKVSVGEAPAVGTTVVSRMTRHVWAMERLWEGLYVPSNAAWKAGAKALQEDPFPAEVLEHGGVYGRTAAKDFRSLAAQAPAKEAPKERAALYAGLLGTCASCHLATGRGGQ